MAMIPIVLPRETLYELTRDSRNREWKKSDLQKLLNKTFGKVTEYTFEANNMRFTFSELTERSRKFWRLTSWTSL